MENQNKRFPKITKKFAAQIDYSISINYTKTVINLFVLNNKYKRFDFLFWKTKLLKIFVPNVLKNLT